MFSVLVYECSKLFEKCTGNYETNQEKKLFDFFTVRTLCVRLFQHVRAEVLPRITVTTAFCVLTKLWLLVFKLIWHQPPFQPNSQTFCWTSTFLWKKIHSRILYYLFNTYLVLPFKSSPHSFLISCRNVTDYCSETAQENKTKILWARALECWRPVQGIFHKSHESIFERNWPWRRPTPPAAVGRGVFDSFFFPLLTIIFILVLIVHKLSFVVFTLSLHHSYMYALNFLHQQWFELFNLWFFDRYKISIQYLAIPEINHLW